MMLPSSGRERTRVDFAVLLILALCPFVCRTAPVQESSDLQHYQDGCYYNYNYYNEGDRILTNEPCLNCTCHNKMLMCYLRVCPFTKPIGHDCTIEKREDQCCPIITCPEELLEHQSSSTQLGMHQKQGCDVNGKFYSEGMQVPSSPSKPCELCYCIRNRTSCIMQECTLHVSGCQPIYHRGVCCPVRYNCDYDTATNYLLEDELTTTVRPTPGFMLTTMSTTSSDCVHDGNVYADGALIESDKPCEHCYCMRGDIVCAVQECEMPLSKHGANCTALPPSDGECCPNKYTCTDMEKEVTISPDEGLFTKYYDEKTTTEIYEEHATSRPVGVDQDLHEGISEEDVQLQKHIDDIIDMDANLDKKDKTQPAPTKDIAPEIELGTEEPSRSSESSTEPQLEESSPQTDGVEHEPQFEKDKGIPELHTVRPDAEETEKPEVAIDEISTESSGIKASPEESLTEVPVIETNEIVPISIPGEGDCLVDSITYKNNTTVPSNSQCDETCICANSIVSCKQIECEKLSMENCMKIAKENSCCDISVCRELEMKSEDDKSPETKLEYDHTEASTIVADQMFTDKPEESLSSEIPKVESSASSVDSLQDLVTFKPGQIDSDSLLGSSTVASTLQEESVPSEMGKDDETKEIANLPTEVPSALDQESDDQKQASETPQMEIIKPSQAPPSDLGMPTVSSVEIVDETPSVTDDSVKKDEAHPMQATTVSPTEPEGSYHRKEEGEPPVPVDTSKKDIQTSTMASVAADLESVPTVLEEAHREQGVTTPKSPYSIEDEKEQPAAVTEIELTEAIPVTEQGLKEEERPDDKENAVEEELDAEKERPEQEEIQPIEDEVKQIVSTEKSAQETVQPEVPEATSPVHPPDLEVAAESDSTSDKKHPDESSFDVTTDTTDKILPEISTMGTKTEKPIPSDSDLEASINVRIPDSSEDRTEKPATDMKETEETGKDEEGKDGEEKEIVGKDEAGKVEKEKEEEVKEQEEKDEMQETTEIIPAVGVSGQTEYPGEQTDSKTVIKGETEKPENVVTEMVSPEEITRKPTSESLADDDVHKIVESETEKSLMPEISSETTSAESVTMAPETEVLIEEMKYPEDQSELQKPSSSDIPHDIVPEGDFEISTDAIDVATKIPDTVEKVTTEGGTESEKVPLSTVSTPKTSVQEEISTKMPYVYPVPDKQGVEIDQQSQEEAATQNIDLDGVSKEVTLIPESTTKGQPLEEVATTESVMMKLPVDQEPEKPEGMKAAEIEGEQGEMRPTISTIPEEVKESDLLPTSPSVGQEEGYQTTTKAIIKDSTEQQPMHLVTSAKKDTSAEMQPTSTIKPSEMLEKSTEIADEVTVATVSKTTPKKEMPVSESTSTLDVDEKVVDSDKEKEQPYQKESSIKPVDTPKEDVTEKMDLLSPDEEQSTQSTQEGDLTKDHVPSLDLMPMLTSTGKPEVPAAADLTKPSTEKTVKEPEGEQKEQTTEEEPTPVEFTPSASPDESMKIDAITEISPTLKDKGTEAPEDVKKSEPAVDVETDEPAKSEEPLSSTAQPGIIGGSKIEGVEPPSSTGQPEIKVGGSKVEEAEPTSSTGEPEIMGGSKVEEVKPPSSTGQPEIMGVSEAEGVEPPSSTGQPEIKVGGSKVEEAEPTSSTGEPEIMGGSKVEEVKPPSSTGQPEIMGVSEAERVEPPSSTGEPEIMGGSKVEEVAAPSSTGQPEMMGGDKAEEVEPLSSTGQPELMGGTKVEKVEPPSSTGQPEMMGGSKAEEVEQPSSTGQPEIMGVSEADGVEPPSSTGQPEIMGGSKVEEAEPPSSTLEPEIMGGSKVEEVKPPSSTGQLEIMGINEVEGAELPSSTGQPEIMGGSKAEEVEPPSSTGQPEIMGGTKVEKVEPPSSTGPPEIIGVSEAEGPPSSTGQPEIMGGTKVEEVEPPSSTGQPEIIGVSEAEGPPSSTGQPDIMGGTKVEEVELPSSTGQPEIMGGSKIETIEEDKELMSSTVTYEETDEISKTEKPGDLVQPELSTTKPEYIKPEVEKSQTETPETLDGTHVSTDTYLPEVATEKQKITPDEMGHVEGATESIVKTVEDTREENVQVTATEDKDYPGKKEEYPESTDVPVLEPESATKLMPVSSLPTTIPPIVEEDKISVTDQPSKEEASPEQTVDHTVPSVVSSTAEDSIPNVTTLPEKVGDGMIEQLPKDILKDPEVPSKDRDTSPTTEGLPTQPSVSSTPQTISKPTEKEEKEKLKPEAETTVKPSTTPDYSRPESPYPHLPQPPSYGHLPPQYPSYSEDEYGEEDEGEVFGPGTCRYGGKLFVSAQQIPRDDPCDFCFCFRSDIICLQQSCPPPISGCHEEPIQGFCCPRYECPVSMATVLNVTTSTTTTSTTLPPHFLPHAYNGGATKNGCQIQGKSYKIGDKIESTSGPCMNCSCGGDGQMKCEPKACTPEPMLRQMIAVVASRRR